MEIPGGKNPIFLTFSRGPRATVQVGTFVISADGSRLPKLATLK